MKANTWKTILQIAISILTAIATTLGVTSCMGLRKLRNPVIKVMVIKVIKDFQRKLKGNE